MVVGASPVSGLAGGWVVTLASRVKQESLSDKVRQAGCYRTTLTGFRGRGESRLGTRRWWGSNPSAFIKAHEACRRSSSDEVSRAKSSGGIGSLGYKADLGEPRSPVASCWAHASRMARSYIMGFSWIVARSSLLVFSSIMARSAPLVFLPLPAQ